MKTVRKKKTQTKPKPIRYLVMIRRTATGYSVDVPDLLGCVAVARTIRGARRLIAEAIPVSGSPGEAVPAPCRRED